ncbi:hypothetical protein AVEN_67351-1 [Araneus ventricosus]|uniref:Peptidase aspartic putative domain-containing protein n=1 Tax=Araneus ventricosus TaxID=182803 RepID=A0A4Y2GX70_ARAVE|nr:hypothetical protein AVEN_67351-1 [Araneus ventricosus]
MPPAGAAPELTLRNINDPDKFITLDVIETPLITTAEVKPPDAQIKCQLKNLGISLMTHPSADRETISVLIGRFSLSELNSAESICSNLLFEEKLSRTLESFWNIESLRVNSPDEQLEDEEALRFFENSILLKNNRYEVRFPWINENVISHDNYANAERRFFNLLKQFRSNLNLYEEYETDKHKDSTPLCDSPSKVLGLE